MARNRYEASSSEPKTRNCGKKVMYAATTRKSSDFAQTMRHLTRQHSFFWISKHKLFNPQPSSNLISYLSSLTKFSKPSRYKKAKDTNLKDQAETATINSLFKEITQILGTENIIPEKNPSGFSILRETHVGVSEIVEKCKCSAPGVCENAEVHDLVQVEKSLLPWGDTQIGDLEEIDVSPIVHEITGVVRAENKAASMEERLERLEFKFEPEIVEKVLKRCFKVPHLAFRFFNLVKMKDGFHHTTTTFNTMLYIAGDAGDLEMADKLVEEMERSCCAKDIKTWTILISLYGRAKLSGKALLLFEKMRKSGCEPDAGVYKAMIRSLCNAGKAEIAFEFYKEMIQREMGLNPALYKLLLTTLAMSGDVLAVNMVSDEMIRTVLVPERDVHICVLKGFCMAGRIREALELIRNLMNKEIPLDYEYFETLVRGLCRADRIADALEIVEIMKKRQFVDAKIYGILVNGYLRRKELSKALDLFEIMKESEHLPTASTYTELMQGLFDLNEYQKGCELYNEMLEKGITMDNVAIMAMVAGHIRQNRMSQAWEVFKSMEDKGLKPTYKSYTIFIKELCRVKRSDEVFKVLFEMQVSKMFIPDHVFHWVISCMENKGEIGNVKKVKQMWEIYRPHALENEVRSNNVPSETKFLVESHDGRSGQGQTDCHLIKPLAKDYEQHDLQGICGILSSPMNWDIIQAALEKCTISFSPGLVVDILKNCSMHGNAVLHFFSWVGKQTGYRHTTETYNMAMKIAGRGKNFKHMRSLFYEMRRNRCLITPDTWAIMIMQYGRTGLTELALKTISEMKTNGCKPTASAYKCLIVCLCERKGRKVDEAIKLFQEMIRAGHFPDKELVETYLCCLCEVGSLLEARKCTDSLSKVGFTIPDTYSLYIRALCRSGRLEEALNLANEVGTDQSTLHRSAYGSLVHGLLRKGRQEEALAKVDSMRQAGINPTVHVYTSLIVHFFKEKQTEKALELFGKMQQEGCEPTVVTYSALIHGYMNVGKVEDAWNIFRSLKLRGPPPDFQTYSMFISCLCKANKSEGALELISEMLDSGIVPSTVNFRTVYFGLNREGKQNLAHTVLQKKWALIRKRKFSA